MNPWSINPNDPETIKYLMSMGQMPQGDIPQAPAPQSYDNLMPNSVMIGATPNPSGPLDMNGMGPQGEIQRSLQMAAVGSPNDKGVQQKIEQKSNTQVKRTSNRTNLLDEDEARRMILAAQGGYVQPKTDDNGQTMYEKVVDPITGLLKDDLSHPVYDFSNVEWDKEHPYQKQKQAIEQMQQMIGKQAEVNQGRNETNLKPLAAFADAINAAGGHPQNMAASYGPQINSADKTMQEMSNLLKNKAELNKEALDNAKLQKAGMSTEQLLQAQALGNMYGTGNQKDLMGLAQQRNDWLEHRQNLKYLQNNPGLRNMLGGIFAIENSQTIMRGSELNKNSFAEAQNLSRIGSQVGANVRTTGDERGGTYMQDLSKQIGAFLDNYVSGGSLKIAKNDPQVKHFVELNNELKGAILGYKDQMLDAAVNGNSRIYHRGTPESDSMFQDIKDSVANFKGVGKNAVNTSIQGNAPHAKSGGRVSVVGPNGERKTLPASQVGTFLTDPDYKGWKRAK